jgi:hypothetical protein
VVRTGRRAALLGFGIVLVFELGSWLPSRIWHGALYERCDQEVADHFGTSPGVLNASLTRTYWKPDMQWRCVFDVDDTAVTLRVWGLP